MQKITFQSGGHKKKGLLRNLPRLMGLSVFLLIFSLSQSFAAEPALTSLHNVDFSNPANQNPVTIKGKVTDKTNAPLVGVSIIIQGTSTGTTTDYNGNYSITVKTGQTLVFSFVGYKKKAIIVRNQTVVNIVMEESTSSLNEVVVVGYGTQKKIDLTGSVSSVSGKDLIKSVTSASVSNSIAGQLPGVIVNNRSGEPGNDASTILIRGFNSFSGGTRPLVIVDGIPDRNFNRLNPDDIASITVLKDASAAIYGVRSANGVILITTKRGKSGKPTIHYDGSVGWQDLTRIPERVNAWQYMTYYNELALNHGNTAPYDQSEIDKYRAGNDPNYTSTDWSNAVFRQNAPQTNHSLSVSGGNNAVKYYFSTQYLKQTSNFANSDQSFQEFNILSNIDAQVSKNIKISLDIAARKEDRDNPAISDGSILHEAVSMYPFLPIYWPNGSADACISKGRNPIIMTSSLPGYDNTTNLILNPKLGFDIKLPFITKGLSISGYGAFDYNYRSEKRFTQPWDAYTYDKTNDTYSNQRNSTSILSIMQDEQLTNQNTYFVKVAFDRKFGKHKINAFAGYEQTNSSWKETYAYRRDLLSNQLDQLYTGSDKNQIGTGYASQDGRESFLGRMSYDYNSKYLVDVTLRYNGSFNFPKDKRWGMFPSVSLGWRISQEKFFKENIKIFDYLKIRASWGLMGSDDVAQYYFLTRYKVVRRAEDLTYFGPNYTLAEALYLSATPNPDITWERQDSKNIGFDAALLSGKLNISFDAFRYLRKDILAQRNASIPLYTGLSLPYENIGKSLNRGLDFSINYNEHKSKVKYHIGVNFTFAKSKIIFKDESPNTPEWQRATGFPIDSWVVFKTKGIYHTQGEVDGSPHLSGAAPGDLWIEDINGDGNITNDDKVRVPNSATPKITFGIPIGFQYKNFSLDMVWSGQAMAKQLILPQMQGSVVSPPTWLYNGRWTKDNPDAPYPRAFNYNDYRNSVFADFWLRDASFLRLKSAMLSYTIAAKYLKKAGISKLKIYIAGFNLLSIDGMKKFGVDPETNNITGIAYPQTRIFKCGLNVEL